MLPAALFAEATTVSPEFEKVAFAAATCRKFDKLLKRSKYSVADSFSLRGSICKTLLAEPTK